MWSLDLGAMPSSEENSLTKSTGKTGECNVRQEASIQGARGQNSRRGRLGQGVEQSFSEEPAFNLRPGVARSDQGIQA